MTRLITCSAAVCLVAWASSFLASAQTPPATPAEKATPAKKGPAEEPIDFARARELLKKRQSGAKLTADETAYLERAIAARRAKEKGKGTATGGREQVGLKPLSEMTASDRYQGEDGGLYGGGKNTPPAAHERAAQAELARIRPLGPDGEPAADGRIVFISISMSNATQEFSLFKQMADADSAKSPRVTIIDCAQGDQAMAEWASLTARPWTVAEQTIANAKCTPRQVQVAWIKLANKGPRGSLEEHGKKLQRDTTAVIQNAKAHFPNLRVVYLGSRIYAGYATTGLNPEPYAYESAFVVRWLIQGQIKGADDLNYDASKGAVKAPLLLWGPYFWADGTKPRETDKLVWKREDLAGDGTHPSQSGRRKVAQLLLDFFKIDALAKTWFTR
jgi:hypothetical protein